MKAWFVFLIHSFNVGVWSQTFDKALEKLKAECGNKDVEYKYLGIYFGTSQENNEFQREIRPDIFVF